MLPLLPIQDVKKKDTPSAKLGTQWKKRRILTIESIQGSLSVEVTGSKQDDTLDNVSMDVGVSEPHVMLPVFESISDIYQRQVLGL